MPKVSDVVSFKQAVAMASELDVLLLPYECAEGIEHTYRLLLLLLCLAALSAIVFHLATLLFAFLSSSFTTLLFIATGTISYTPNRVKEVLCQRLVML